MPQKRKFEEEEEINPPIIKRRISEDEGEETPRKRRFDNDEEDIPPRKRLSGWAAVAKKKQEYEENKNEGPYEFWLSDGEEAIIQFLQDEPFVVDGHSVKIGSAKNFKFVPCQLNTQRHCLMCREGIKLITKFAFKILDYRGDWDKDKKQYKYNKKVEKIWIVGIKVAEALKARVDRTGKELSEVVLNVSRSGSGKTTSYNFEKAFDEDDVPLRPIKYKEEFPPIEEILVPPSDKKLETLGFSDEDDD
jgi:hypothetical protein